MLTLSHVSIAYPSRKAGIPGFFGATAPREVVHDVSLSLPPGQTLGLVGESGCGKTTLARAILGLVPITSGSLSITPTPTHSARAIQMVFQDPFSSLNPRLSVLELLSEAPVKHGLWTRAEREDRTRALLSDVGLPSDILLRYPHAFSGGQRQRLNIARALALQPQILICDEPVSALDVSVQAQVLNLLADLQQKHSLSMLFITHDLAVVRHVAHTIAVMQAGRIVELDPTHDIFTHPTHPYTQSLLDACLDLPAL